MNHPYGFRMLNEHLVEYKVIFLIQFFSLIYLTDNQKLNNVTIIINELYAR